MKLFVMRHAQATFNAPSDRERPITDNGEKQTRELLSLYQQDLSQVGELWCSDLLRACQTAALVTEVTGLPALQKTMLSPDGQINHVLNELQQFKADEHLMIVSHQPLVGELVSYLISGNIYQAHPFTTSEILSLELEQVGPGMASLCKQYLPG